MTKAAMRQMAENFIDAMVSVHAIATRTPTAEDYTRFIKICVDLRRGGYITPKEGGYVIRASIVGFQVIRDERGCEVVFASQAFAEACFDPCDQKVYHGIQLLKILRG